ncbi:MAG: hypothetical protein EXS31_13055 [Pedosphaera sp.]|nr:hypothetical protein [Pedosphaera sp.]
MKFNNRQSRRRFITNATQCAAAAIALPNLLTASKAATQLVVGQNEHRYEVLHDWAQLPDKYTWQTTHNVAVDREGLLYVIHEGREELKDHPSIFVFDQTGKFVRAFGSQFQGGGHGLEVITEGREQFLYVTGYQQLKNFAKLTLKGEMIWERRAPMASGIYPEGEAAQPKKVWGRNRFMPTNYAFRPDGGFYLADGYGAFRIHQYDKHGNWLSAFGAVGKGPGEFNTPHGICYDARPGREPMLAVADRANARLQWFTLDGQHRKTLDGFILPANLDTYKDLMLVPDLSARITLLDGKDNVVAHLGEDPAWREQVVKDGNKMRSQPERWVAGKFLHPHDACFDADGNIIVAEWVHTGRITKLRKLS